MTLGGGRWGLVWCFLSFQVQKVTTHSQDKTAHKDDVHLFTLPIHQLLTSMRSRRASHRMSQIHILLFSKYCHPKLTFLSLQILKPFSLLAPNSIIKEQTCLYPARNSICTHHQHLDFAQTLNCQYQVHLCISNKTKPTTSYIPFPGKPSICIPCSTTRSLRTLFLACSPSPLDQACPRRLNQYFRRDSLQSSADRQQTLRLESMT